MRAALRPSWPLKKSLVPWLPRTSPHPITRHIATTSTENAAPGELSKLPGTPGSSHHNSLFTFLDYAKRKNLNINATVYVGTHYEYSCALALMRLGFSLLRTGAKNDAGIDLIGHWVLEPLRDPIPVIIQCKAWKNQITPSYIRELEGSFRRIPPDWRRKEVFGLLVTTQKATKGILQALSHSGWPLGYLMVSKVGTIQQFVWNRAASERGLEGVGVTLRHTPWSLVDDDAREEEAKTTASQKTPKKTNTRLAKFKNAGTRKDIQLTWMGSPIFPERESLDQETVKLMQHIMTEDAEIPEPIEKPERGRRAKTPEIDQVVVVPKSRGRPKASSKETETTVEQKRGRTRATTKEVTPEVKRAPGRPRTTAKETAPAIKQAPGRPRVKDMIPTVKRSRGRPTGTTTKETTSAVKRAVGRPKGSKDAVPRVRRT